MGYEKWQSTAAGMARQQFILQGALSRMVKQAMAQAWEKWQQTYVDMKFANLIRPPVRNPLVGGLSLRRPPQVATQVGVIDTAAQVLAAAS